MNATAIRRAACLFFAAVMTGCGSGGGSAPITIEEPSLGFPTPGRSDAEVPKPGTTRPVGLQDKSFVSGGRSYAPMDILSQNLSIRFDVDGKVARAHSRIRFRTPAGRRPLFLLGPSVTEIRSNAVKLIHRRIEDPDRKNSFVAIEKDFTGETEIEVEYELSSSSVSFENGGASFLTAMADLLARFFEQWGPSGFEEDTFALTLEFAVVDGLGHPSRTRHQLFSNGWIENLGDERWRIRFPEWFNGSAFYAHMTNKALHVRKSAIESVDGRLVPVVVYSSRGDLAEVALGKLPSLFREMEKDYGPYPHPAFLAYLSGSSGGIEFAGATITSMNSLPHELFHSWFARGVMPADAHSGWIDEAAASWRDYGYQRADQLLARSKTNMSRFSKFVRATPSNSYSAGRELFAEWDLLFAKRGGFKPLLRKFGETHRHQLVTTRTFKEFLEEETGDDLSAYFDRYVSSSASAVFYGTTIVAEDGPYPSLHPTPLTEDEIRELR